MDQFVAACQQAAQIGGEQLLRHRHHFQTREKKAHDFVTDADIASQRAIFDFLHEQFPDHGFLGEESIESHSAAGSESPYCWIVDPLDGTLNYVHQLQSYSVSVALRRGDRIIVGAVFDPVLNEMFLAADSQTATLNGEPINVSGCTRLGQALVVVSLPNQVAATTPELEPFLQILYSARSVRRLGSAALNLCYVAAGRLDAYWATTVNIWDIAAGYLILQQAGGTMRDISGGQLNLDQPKFAAAASDTLCSELLQVVRQ